MHPGNKSSPGHSRYSPFLETIFSRKFTARYTTFHDSSSMNHTAISSELTVLIVDDTPDDLALMRQIIDGSYRVKVARHGDAALTIVESDDPPDLILLDTLIPGRDGYEICRQLKAKPAANDIPVIFLTASNSVEDEARGLALGAVDYISKPISPPILLARIKTHLTIRQSQLLLKGQNHFLEREVKRRSEEIELIQDITVHTLASLAETRDNDTGHHIRRTQHYVRILAEALRHHPQFRPELDDDRTIDLLFKSAPLHDIGKVGIPDRILLKPGPLDADEFRIMKTHARLGYEAILQAERELGKEIPFLQFAKQIALGHHERWNGTGYPQGLSGDDIPVSARLMALADVYDALISRRVYKEGMSYEAARQIILNGKGLHFDPDIVDAFMTVEEAFKATAALYADPSTEREAFAVPA
jgi:putative two-component system response regulator